MRIDKQYWWQTLNHNLLGNEGEGEGGSGSGEGGNSGESGQGSSGNDGDSGSGASDDDKSSKGEDVSGLKSALEKEREDRRAAEKELKKYQKAEKEREDAEKTEVQRLTDKGTKDQDKIGKLAAKFRVNEIDRVIRAAAEKFIDPGDVADKLRNHPDIKVEQDEDDPSSVTVDAKSVQKLVDNLAKDKTHWLKGQGPSGSKFGGTGDSGDRDQALVSKYPALANRLSSGTQ